MFHRIHIEEWQHTLSVVSFVIFFVVFTGVLIRVFTMSREKRRHLKNLPLEEEKHVRK
jgi:fructose-specific phosphotransferase system IIC component